MNPLLKSFQRFGSFVLSLLLLNVVVVAVAAFAGAAIMGIVYV